MKRLTEHEATKLILTVNDMFVGLMAEDVFMIVEGIASVGAVACGLTREQFLERFGIAYDRAVRTRAQ